MSKKSILMGSNMSLILATGIAPAIVHQSAYANTLTGLIPDLYAGMDVVSRELVGMVPSVSRDSTAERAAVGQTVTSHISKPKTAVNIVPAMQVPEPRDTDRGIVSMTLTDAKKVEFGYTGEEQRGLNSGPGAMSVQADEFAQGLRTLVNMIEAAGCVETARGASRAAGAAGTTPFTTDLSDSALLRQILDDNGAPSSERSLIGNTNMGVKLRSQTQLTKANEAGTTMTLRQGELLDLHGFSIKESAGIVNHTKGTTTNATTNAAGYAVGATVITLAAVAGGGSIVAGDVITFAGDTNKYVVDSGDADTTDGGTITLAEPGLRVAIAASATAITVGANYAANVGFSRNAIQLAMRAPALPQGGDLAIDRMMITDPRSGMTFEVALYAGYRMISAEVSAVWGWKAVKPEHIALLLG